MLGAAATGVLYEGEVLPYEMSERHNCSNVVEVLRLQVLAPHKRVTASPVSHRHIATRPSLRPRLTTKAGTGAGTGGVPRCEAWCGGGSEQGAGGRPARVRHLTGKTVTPLKLTHTPL